MAFFYTPKPKKFNYIPRFYDPEKEAWEKKKAEMGLSSQLSHEEQLRLSMRKKWKTGQTEEDKAYRTQRLIKRFVMGAVVLLLFYFIFGTPVMTNIISGLMGK
jgi:hypothetical protein